MKKLFGIAMLLLSVAGIASASYTPVAPEIDPTSGMSAVALLSGAVFLFRGRRK